MKLHKDIIETVKQNGGATLTTDLMTAQIENGYMVSLENHEQVIDLETATEHDITPMIETAEQIGGFVGLWADLGKLYIDISVNVKDKAQALKMGHDNKQLAIYDIEGDTVIDLR